MKERGTLPGIGLTKVSAYSQAVEPFRILRLHAVLGYLAAKGLGDSAIEAVHDHKGKLTVTWLREPTPYDKKAVEEAWSWQFEYEVEHQVGLYPAQGV